MPDDQARKGSRFTKLLTGLGKLGGLILGLNEGFGQARPAVMLYAAAIWVGSQAAEDFVLKIIQQTFGDSR